MTIAKLAKPDFDTKIVTPTFRLSYPHLFEAHYNELGKREQYDLVMMFDKKDKALLKDMYDLMARVAKFRFGANTKGLKNPFKDGDTATSQSGELIKEKNPSYEGMLILGSWTKNKPGVVNAKNQIILDHDEVYGGCYCKAQLNCYAYETGGNRGVSFGLLHVQKIKDGDPFGSRTKPEDAFAPVASAGESMAEETQDGGMFS